MARRIDNPTRQASRSVRQALVIACVALASSRATANDVIHLRQPGSEAVIPIPAVIDDFTGKFILFRVGTSVRQEQTSSVVQTEHNFSEGFKRGQSLFEAGNYEAAEAEWKKDLVREPKTWVQREIRSWLVRAALRQNHWMDAARQFLEITTSDPDTFHWPTAPLVWTPTSLSAEDRATARALLGDERPAARLLGASLLLKDPSEGEMAARMLDGLVREPSPQVAGLAKAQLWRNQQARPISDHELARWRGHIAFLPETLRGGPQYLLGSACFTRGEFDRAAAELLWVPLIYSQHEPTAARASLEAGEALLRAGRRDDAVKVLNETVDKYGWSSAARDAKARLAELTAR